MAIISPARVSGFLTRCDDLTLTTTERGRAFEDLAIYLFRKVPGVDLSERDALNAFQSEEIDVALWNERRPSGLYFLSNILLVECKNWSNPVGSIEVAWFIDKLRERCMDFGVLLAMNGITGVPVDLTSARHKIAGAQKEGRRVVVITRTDITALGSSDDLVHLMKKKLCQLAVSGTSI